MEKLDESLAKITDALTEIAKTHGQDAVDMTLEVARLHAITGITMDVVVGIVAAFLCKFFYGQIKNTNLESFYHETTAPVLSFIAGGVSTICLISLLQPYRWIGMFEPKLYLAYRMLEKFI
jgi:hypothetical protein